MQEDKKKQAFPRDRKGEIFQDDLGEDHTAFPPDRDDAAHEVNMEEDVDSQEADEFMQRQFGKETPERARSENRPAQRPK